MGMENYLACQTDESNSKRIHCLATYLSNVDVDPMKPNTTLSLTFLIAQLDLSFNSLLASFDTVFLDHCLQNYHLFQTLRLKAV